MAEEEKKQSATEVLVAALESFGESEPEAVMVLFTNEAGELRWRSNIDSVCMRLGMLRYADAAMVKRGLEMTLGPDPK